MRTWLSFALLSLVAGCAGEHVVTPDAGGLPVVDAFVPVDAAALTCRGVAVTAGQAPAAVAILAPIPVHLVSDAGSSTSCGCHPRPDVDPTGAVSLSVCDCCDTCDCVDFGYEATVVETAVEGTPRGVPVTLSVSPLVTTTVVDPASCIASDATVTGITVLGPSPRLRQGPLVGAWVELSATAARCCGEPLTLVTSTPSAGGVIDLSLAECHPDPCDCAASIPHDASTAVYLGALASGTYTVRAGSVSTTLTIP